MNYSYTVGENEVIKLLQFPDMFEDSCIREADTAQLFENGKFVSSPVLFIEVDANGVYFFYLGKKHYLRDFDCISVDEIISLIEKEREKHSNCFMYSDELLAVMVRYSNEIGFVCNLPVFETVIPKLNMGITGEKTEKVVCKLSEKRYKKGEWGYKITLEPADENLKSVIASREFYFDDFCRILIRGDADLVKLVKI